MATRQSCSGHVATAPCPAIRTDHVEAAAPARSLSQLGHVRQPLPRRCTGAPLLPPLSRSAGAAPYFRLTRRSPVKDGRWAGERDAGEERKGKRPRDRTNTVTVGPPSSPALHVRELFLLHGECDAMTRVGTREGRGHGAWAWLHAGPAGVLDQIGHVPINPLTSQSISRSMLRGYDCPVRNKTIAYHHPLGSFSPLSSMRLPILSSLYLCVACTRVCRLRKFFLLALCIYNVFNKFSIQNLANVTRAAESSRNFGSCVAACKCRPLSGSKGLGDLGSRARTERLRGARPPTQKRSIISGFSEVQISNYGYEMIQIQASHEER
jgi:hypothetical protein